MNRNRKLAAFMAMLALLMVAVLAACGGTSTPSTSQSPAPTPTPTSVRSTTTPAPAAPSSPTPGPKTVTTGGVIAAFGSAVPGTEEALQELRQAKEAGFTELVNYSSMNGETPAAINGYLDAAFKLHVGIIFSIKDVLGRTDEDSEKENRSLHQQYGKSTKDKVDSVARQFIRNRAVTRVLISDELPGGPEDLAKWRPFLKERSNQIHQIAPGKPVMVALYWSGPNTAFYGAVKKYADDFAIDFYPYPTNLQYGSVDTIPTIGLMLNQTAGRNGWFIVQAFGWGAVNHSEGVDLGYANDSYAPPTADVMVKMAEAAVRGGAKNLMFYSLSDDNPAKLAEVKKAVTIIRAADWWTLAA